MNRRHFLQVSAIGSVPLFARAGNAKPASSPEPGSFQPARFSWEESGITELQEAMQAGRTTALALVRAYRARIHELDQNGPRLNSVIELNPEAESIARDLDHERKEKGARGPLHGIPLLLKDNIDTADKMMTTAGSLALLGSIAARDAFLVERLRAAGAVILGKTNLSEWANFRSGRSTSGWSGRGGLTRNPYVLDRNASGSSSGSAVAASANLCAGAIGTETDGSIISPSSYCGIVGLKPTVGLISRSGIIPISSTQDTAGPMTRSVRDAAILLSALTGSDPRDPATQASDGKSSDYTSFLDSDGLKKVRLGVVRKYLPHKGDLAFPVIEQALKTLKENGATLVDVEMPSFEQIGDAEFEVLLYEFKEGLNRYLADLGPTARVRSLKELIAFNALREKDEMPFFRQETLIRAEARGELTKKKYLESLEKCRRLSRDEGIDPVMEKNRLDALVVTYGGPAHVTDLVHGDRDTGGNTSIAAVARYPSISVPAGQILGLPVGVAFMARAWDEGRLLRLAYAFEQASRARKAPGFLDEVTRT